MLLMNDIAGGKCTGDFPGVQEMLKGFFMF